MTMNNAGGQGTQGESVQEEISDRLEHEAWRSNEDLMSQAVHNVYCGIMADHDGPNDKDREQARQLIAAIGQQI
jgi:hypothetical protein